MGQKSSVLCQLMVACLCLGINASHATTPLEDDSDPPIPASGSAPVPSTPAVRTVPIPPPMSPAAHNPAPFSRPARPSVAPIQLQPAAAPPPAPMPQRPALQSPAQAPTVVAAPPALPPKDLNIIQGAFIENNQLKIVGQSKQKLMMRPPFALSNPNRLVIDIADAQLGNVGLPFQPGSIGDVPVHNIRLGQFTLDTVRLVIETPEPDRLAVELESDTRLSITGAKARNPIANLYHFIFGGRNEPVAQTPPQAAPPLQPTVPQANPPITGTMVTVPTTPQFPHLDNLRRISMQAPTNEAYSPQRQKIIEVARSQLGLSKDNQRDYVINTFSRGKDEAWCADFISTILNWTGGSPWGHLSRVEDIYRWGHANQRLTIRPDAGNIVIFSYDGQTFHHAAFVEAMNPDNTISTIGGNEGYARASGVTRGSVARSTYNLDDRSIFAIVDPVLPNRAMPQPSSHSSYAMTPPQSTPVPPRF